MKRATFDQDQEIPDAVVIKVSPDLLDTLDQLPQEVKIKTCLRLEIVDLLDRYSSPAIRSVLEDEYFWRKKLKYDFPDLVEFVGTGLPSWIFALKGSRDEAQDYRPMGPWRRYYYTARYFMRLVYKALVSFASKWAPACNALIEGMPPRRFKLDYCQMVPGKTRLVSLTVQKTATMNPERGTGSARRHILDITAFCARYLITDVGLAHIYQDSIENDDPWYYAKRQETVNPIRMLMMQVAWYEKLTRNAIFSSALNKFFGSKSLNKFMGWIFHLNPVFDPYDRRVPASLEFPFRTLKKSVSSNVWVRDSTAPFAIGTALPTITAATEYTRAKSMHVLWSAMEVSRLAPDELKMTVYDEGYLRWRSSYLGMPRDKGGKMLIGLPLVISEEIKKSSLIECNGQPLTLERAEVVHLIDQVTANKTQLHLPLIQSQDMQVMAMAVERKVPMETHSDMSQLLVVVEGTALLTVKATQTERGEDMRCLPVSHHMQAGDAYLIPRRTPHHIQNTSEDGQILRMFTVYSPPNHKE